MNSSGLQRLGVIVELGFPGKMVEKLESESPDQEVESEVGLNAEFSARELRLFGSSVPTWGMGASQGAIRSSAHPREVKWHVQDPDSKDFAKEVIWR